MPLEPELRPPEGAASSWGRAHVGLVRASGYPRAEVRNLVAVFGLLAALSVARGPARAEGDLAVDVGAGQPGISRFDLEVTVQGFKPPPEGTEPPRVLEVRRSDVFEPGCGPPTTQRVELDLEPCPENVWFYLESPQLDAPIVYELFGIRRALRFDLPAEVRRFTITFVEMSGVTTAPLTLDL